MAEQKQSDPIGLFIITLGILGGLALIIDWSNFKDFGKTSTPAPASKAELVKRLRGFGPQCNLDDEFVPCTHQPVIIREAK